MRHKVAHALVFLSAAGLCVQAGTHPLPVAPALNLTSARTVTAVPAPAVVRATLAPAVSPANTKQAVLAVAQGAQMVKGAENALASLRYQQALERARKAAAARAAALARQQAQAAQAAPAPAQAPAGTSAGAYSYLITTAYQACVVQAESGGNWMIWNASGHWGWYQFAYATWVGNGGAPALFGNAGPAYQTQIFWNTYRADGTQPWMSDGC